MPAIRTQTLSYTTDTHSLPFWRPGIQFAELKSNGLRGPAFPGGSGGVSISFRVEPLRLLTFLGRCLHCAHCCLHDTRPHPVLSSQGFPPAWTPMITFRVHPTMQNNNLSVSKALLESFLRRLFFHDQPQVSEMKTSNICGAQYTVSHVSYVYLIDILMPDDIKENHFSSVSKKEIRVMTGEVILSLYLLERMHCVTNRL